MMTSVYSLPYTRTHLHLRPNNRPSQLTDSLDPFLRALPYAVSNIIYPTVLDVDAWWWWLRGEKKWWKGERIGKVKRREKKVEKENNAKCNFESSSLSFHIKHERRWGEELIGEMNEISARRNAVSCCCWRLCMNFESIYDISLRKATTHCHSPLNLSLIFQSFPHSFSIYVLVSLPLLLRLLIGDFFNIELSFFFVTFASSQKHFLCILDCSRGAACKSNAMQREKTRRSRWRAAKSNFSLIQSECEPEFSSRSVVSSQTSHSLNSAGCRRLCRATTQNKLWKKFLSFLLLLSFAIPIVALMLALWAISSLRLRWRVPWNVL